MLKLKKENLIEKLLKDEAENLVISAQILSDKIEERREIIERIYEYALRQLYKK